MTFQSGRIWGVLRWQGFYVTRCSGKKINGVSASHFFPPAQNPPKPRVSETVRSFLLILQQHFVGMVITAKESLKRTTVILTVKQIYEKKIFYNAVPAAQSRD